MEYDLGSVRLPRLSGWMLRLFVAVLEGPLRGLLMSNLFDSAGITRLRAQHIEAPPTMYPTLHIGVEPTTVGAMPQDEWPGEIDSPGPGFSYATVHDYASAYRESPLTPEEVAEHVLAAIAAADAADPPLRAFIAVDRDDVLRQARASTERIRSGRPLSVLDGVPVAVKDELDMVSYPTTVGTTFLGRAPATEDATAVARLRAAGALLIGKANMHEIGIGVTGLNPHHGTPRNPHAPDRHTGGSSSGSAVAVATGLCPVALGADGGGSIRIPAALCGVIGLKPTFGRVSGSGVGPLDWSVAHVGPLATTVTDLALAYAAIAGADPRDPISLRQPAPTLHGWDEIDLSGLTLGVYWPWFHHADGEVVAVCEALLEQLQSLGAGLREVTIPHLEFGRVAHSITIASEMTQALAHTYAKHHREHGPDVRINLALARQFTARDYLQAQQVRTGMIEAFDRALSEVDVIVTPATGIPAPLISPRALRGGESDLTTLIELMRFTTPANLTGLPAISFPAGYTLAGLPVGMQAIGRAWQETTLLRLALAAERVVERRRPELWFEV